jgi:hypothetical protein
MAVGSKTFEAVSDIALSERTICMTEGEPTSCRG